MARLYSPPHLERNSSPPAYAETTPAVSENVADALVARYQSRLLHLAAAYLRDMQSAEDCVQDVFLTALRKLDPALPEGAVYKWLVTCTANRAKSMLRSARLRRLVLMDRHALEEQATRVVDDYAALDESGVMAEMLKLPVKYREVIVLKYYHDLSQSEIAAILRVPENTVKTRLRRGKEMLRHALDPERRNL